MNYYYANGEEAIGPKSLEGLEELYRAGKISAETPVTEEDEASWRPLSDVLGKEKPSETEPSPAEPAHPGAGPRVRTPSKPPPPMKTWEYSVVPFVAVIKTRDNASTAALQLQEMIHSLARHGWEYVRLESVETYIEGEGGCFGIGATPPRTTVCSMVVFRR